MNDAGYFGHMSSFLLHVSAPFPLYTSLSKLTMHSSLSQTLVNITQPIANSLYQEVFLYTDISVCPCEEQLDEDLSGLLRNAQLWVNTLIGVFERMILKTRVRVCRTDYTGLRGLHD